MNSRERINAVLNGKAPDHTPLTTRCFGFKPPTELSWKREGRRIEYWYSLRMEHLHTLPQPWMLRSGSAVQRGLFSYLLADDPGLVSGAFEALNRHEERRAHLVADPEISPLVIVYCDIGLKKDVILSPVYLRKEFFPRLGRLVDVCGDCGLILGSSGEIHPEVRPHNAIALFQTAKRYGRG